MDFGSFVHGLTQFFSNPVQGVENLFTHPQQQTPPPQAPAVQGPSLAQLSNSIQQASGFQPQLTQPNIQQTQQANDAMAALRAIGQHNQKTNPQNNNPQVHDLTQSIINNLINQVPGGHQAGSVAQGLAPHFTPQALQRTIMDPNSPDAQIAAQIPILGPALAFGRQQNAYNNSPDAPSALSQLGGFTGGITGTGIANSPIGMVARTGLGAAATFTPTEQINNPITNFLANGNTQAPTNAFARNYDEANGNVAKALAVAGPILDVLGARAAVGKPGVSPETVREPLVTEPITAPTEVPKVQTPTETPTTPQTAPTQATGAPTVDPATSTATLESHIADAVHESTRIQNAPTGEDLAANAKANGLSENMQNALKDMGDAYRPDLSGETGWKRILAVANGHLNVVKRVGSQLQKAIEGELSRPELQQLRDYSEGALTRDEVSPKVAAISDSLKPLEEAGLTVRQIINGVDKGTENHFARIATEKLKTPEGKVFDENHGGSKSMVAKLKSALNISTDSKFSKSRTVQKFLGPDGKAHFGSMESLGFKRAPGEPNAFVDGEGNMYRAVRTTAKEIENSGVIQYEKNGARVANAYHSDTAGLVTRHATIDALKADESTGLVPTSEAPAGHVEIKGVKELEGYSAPAKVAKAIQTEFGYHSVDHPILQVYDKTSRLITNTIVANPYFHGMNQLFQSLIASGKIPMLNGSRLQSGPVGIAKFMKNITDLAGDAKLNETWTRAYLKAGGHIPSYGVDVHGVLYKYLGKVTKASPAAMREIEARFRVATFKASVESGMDPKIAMQNIDHYLGDANSMGKAAQRTGLFLHYAKTMGGALYGAVRHPIAESGATVNALTLLSGMMGLTYAYQELTGNPDGKLRLPGEIGFAESLIKAPGQAANGQIPSVVTNHVNPIISLTAQEATNRDFSKPVAGPQAPDNNLDANGTRGTIAGRTLFGPGSSIQSLGSGNKAPGEVALSYLIGAYLPHSNGYEAAPNIPALNTDNAQSGTGNMAATKAFYQTQNDAKATLTDKEDLNVFNVATNKMTNPDTGKPVQNGPADTIAIARELYAHPNALLALQKQAQDYANKTGQPLDPKWNLSPDQLRTYENYESQYTGDAGKTTIANQNPWIKQLTADRSAFYKANPIPPSTTSEKNPNTPPYPQFDPQTTSLLNTYDSLASTDKAAFIAKYPQISVAFAKIGDYTKAMRAAEGAPALKDYPTASPDVQKALDAKNYKAPGVQQYLTAVTFYNLAKQGALSQYEGNGYSQAFLKDAYNAGNFDIAKGTNGQFYSPSLPTSQGGTPVPTGITVKGGGFSSSSAKYKAKLPKLRVKIASAPKARFKHTKLRKGKI